MLIFYSSGWRKCVALDNCAWGFEFVSDLTPLKARVRLSKRKAGKWDSVDSIAYLPAFSFFFVEATIFFGLTSAALGRLTSNTPSS